MRIDAPGALPELVRGTEMRAAGGRRRETGRRQYGAQVERGRVPACAGCAVHRPAEGVRYEGTGVRGFWTLFGHCGGDVIPLCAHLLLCVSAVCSWSVRVHSWSFTPLIHRFLGGWEGVAVSFTAQHGSFSVSQICFSPRPDLSCRNHNECVLIGIMDSG